jgi:hypothetical protein
MSSPVPNLPQQLSNSNQFSTVKLDRDNYILWTTQVVPYLEGHSLYGYITGETPAPAKEIASSASSSTTPTTPTMIANPAYALWYQQDKLILSTLISTLSNSVLPYAVGIKTSREVWLTLERMFASESQARIVQIRYQLTSLKKGALTITDYYQKARILAQTLATIDKPLKDSELVLYVLNGLPMEFDSLVTSVTTRTDPISMNDLYGHLLTYEQRIATHHSSPDLSLSSVNVAQRNSAPPTFSTGRGRGYSPNYRGRGRGRGRGPPSSGTFNQYNRDSRPLCQICSKPGHTALRCYQRYDHSYQSDITGPTSNFTSQHAAASDPAWYHDTGSTHHVTNDFSNLNVRAEEYTGSDQIRVSNGQGLKIHHTGLASLPTAKHKFSLHSLLHVPKIQKNLISIHKFTHDNNVFVEFHPNFFRVKDLRTRKLLLQGPSKHGLYPWPTTAPINSAPQTFLGERTSLNQWHYRLGHPAFRVVRAVLSSSNLPVSSHKAPPVCSACQQGKLQKFHFPLNNYVSANPLDLLFLDVWGPAPLLSSNNKRYFLCIVDDFSHYSWVFPITCKSDVYNTFTIFRLLVENFFQSKIKSVQTDGGGEFIPVQTYLSSNGISYRQTCPHTHHQNGSVERKIRHIVDTGLALLSHSSVPLRFWDSSFDTACYLINRLPSSVNKLKSPFELLFHKTPDYKFLKIFGCECWPYLRPYNSNKFSFRSKSCVFLGYSKPHSGYKCLDVISGRIYIARHVVFHEQSFPFNMSTPKVDNSTPTVAGLPSHLNIHTPLNQLNTTDVNSLDHDTSSHDTQSTPASIPEVIATVVPPIAELVPETATVVPTTAEVVSEIAPSINLMVPVAAPPTARTHSMTTRSKNQVHKPKSVPDGFTRYPLPRANTVSLVSAEEEPTYFTQAVKSKIWRDAMATEFNALIQNGTWTLVSPTPSMNIVGSKWVFRIKRKADGFVERYKARLVAKSFHQQPGVDFSETYSPVIKPITIRTVLSMAVTAGWCIKQIDISNAFLHGYLQETVYMSQPSGFLHPNFPDAVCHLKRAIYGLKQAPRAWYSRLSSRLQELGFLGCKSDSSLFIFTTTSVKIFALVYVDDIILTGSSAVAVNSLIKALSIDFPIKDLGSLNFFLGVEVNHVAAGMILTQQRYITDILSRTKMSLVKPITSPMSAAAPLSKFSGSKFNDPTLYRKIVGSLQYLSLT